MLGIRSCSIILVLAFSFPGIVLAAGGDSPMDLQLGVVRDALARGDSLSAADEAYHLLAQNPDPSRANQIRLLLAQALTDWGMAPKAEAILIEMVRKRMDGPTSRAAYLTLGKARAARSDCAGALAAWERVRAGEDAPEMNEAAYRSGLCETTLGQTSRAIRRFERVALPSPFYPFAAYAKAQAIVRAADEDAAGAAFLGLAASNPESDIVRRRMSEKARLAGAALKLEHGRADDVEFILEPIPPPSPFYGRARFIMGWAAIRRGEYARAIVAFRDALNHPLEDPESREARRLIGRCFEFMGAPEKAVEQYRSALTDADRAMNEIALLEKSAAAPPIDRVFEEEGLLISPILPEAYTRRSPSLGMLGLLSDPMLAGRLDAYRNVVRLQAVLRRRSQELSAIADLIDSWQATVWDRYRQFLAERIRFETLLEETRKMETDLRRYSAMMEFRQFTFGKETDLYERTRPGSHMGQDNLETIEKRKEILSDLVTSLPQRVYLLNDTILEGRVSLGSVKAKEETIARALPNLSKRISTMRPRIANLTGDLKRAIERADRLHEDMSRDLRDTMTRTLTARRADLEREGGILKLSIARALDRAATQKKGKP